MDCEAFSVHVCVCVGALDSLEKRSLTYILVHIQVHKKFQLKVSHHRERERKRKRKREFVCDSKPFIPFNGTKFWSHSRGFELSYRDVNTIYEYVQYARLGRVRVALSSRQLRTPDLYPPAPLVIRRALMRLCAVSSGTSTSTVARPSLCVALTLVRVHLNLLYKYDKCTFL